MIRCDDMGPCLDVHAYLVALCALSVELFPDDDWAAVEPRLQRSWERYVAEDSCGWAEVRASARRRWEANSQAVA